MKPTEWYKFLRHPIKHIIHHSQDYIQISRKYTDEINKNRGLIEKNQELDFQVRQLISDLGGLNNETTGLRTKLEERVSELTGKVEESDKVYRMQKSVISTLNRRIKICHKEARKELESSLEQMAENDYEHSLIILGGSGRIIASTPVFREKFSFDNPEDSINGKMFFNIFRYPKNAPDYVEKGKYISDIKYAFRDPQEVAGLETTIVDGEGQLRIIQFTKHKPFSIKIIKEDESGQILTKKDYFYTVVDIYEISKWEKIGGKVKKIFHHKNGDPKALHEFIEKRAIQKIEDKEKEEREYHQEMIQVYAGLISYDSKTWTADNISRVEKEMGINEAKVYLIQEYEKISRIQKQKNELISQIIGDVISYKEK